MVNVQFKVSHFSPHNNSKEPTNPLTVSEGDKVTLDILGSEGMSVKKPVVISTFTPYWRELSVTTIKSREELPRQIKLDISRENLRDGFAQVVAFQPGTVKWQPLIKIQLDNPKWGCESLFRMNLLVEVENPAEIPVDELRVELAVPTYIQGIQEVKVERYEVPEGDETFNIVGSEGNETLMWLIKGFQPREVRNLLLGFTIHCFAKWEVINTPYRLSAQAFLKDQLIEEELDPKFHLYLSPEKGIESDDPNIKHLAQKLMREALNNYWVFLRNVLAYLHKTVQHKPQRREKGALYALLTGVGGSNEFAALTLALLRAARIPARMITGLGLDKGYHVWCEAYLKAEDRWVMLDPTYQQIGHSCEYIIIGQGNGSADGGNLQMLSYRYTELEQTGGPKIIHKMDIERIYKANPYEG